MKNVLGKLIFVLLPFVLVFSMIRIVAFKKVMKWEYRKSSFPRDLFGFTTDDRILYGTMFIDYLFQNKDISYLSRLKFADGTDMFNSRELKHMVDVQRVVQKINLVGLIISGIFILAAAGLIYKKTSVTLCKSLIGSGLLSLLILTVLGLLCLFSFNFIFDVFHRFLGFKESSWIFYQDDTLIRLFPVKYWFDMFMMVVGGVSALSLLNVGMGWYLLKKT